MHLRWMSVILATLSALAGTTGGVPQPVKSQGGLVQGVVSTDGTVVAYKGLPFAAPPVGESRWQAPQAPVSWTGVRQAVRYSDSCVQRIVEERKPWTYEFMAHNAVSEDCLYLNVWTSSASSTANRPVFVWIHGGGYTEGSTAVPTYDGENLARRGIVVVTINYRLGVFGFFAHPELTSESQHHASGNYGMLDQVAALQWVQRNIAAFGGDPKRVTIGGQSAGAGSVHNLVASPLAKGLFHRAIAESGSGIVPNARMLQLAEAEQQGAKFAETLGAKSIADLRKIDPKELLAKITPGPTTGFRPIVDGWFLPASPRDAFAAGKQNDVPTLTGLTADEASSQPDYGKVPAEKWTQQIRQRFGDLADRALALYPSEAGESQKALSREQGMISMHLWAADRAKTAKTKAFTYYWTHAEPGPDSERFGSFHTSEVPYVFNTLDKSDRGWTNGDRKIAQMIGTYWVNFMTSGDPNGRGVPPWPAFDATSARTMELGDRFGPRPLPDKAKVEFFTDYLLRPSSTAR